VRKFDPKHFERLLNPERKKTQDPDVIFGALGLSEGERLADIGVGPGYFALPAAEKVGPTGKIYALDIAAEMLEYLEQRAATAGITNIEAVLSQEVEFPLPDASVDAVLIANVLHETELPVVFLQDAWRILAADGRVAIVEWRRDRPEVGPPLHERLAFEQVEGYLQEAGFNTVEAFEVGPYHFGVRARRSA